MPGSLSVKSIALVETLEGKVSSIPCAYNPPSIAYDFSYCVHLTLVITLVICVIITASGNICDCYKRTSRGKVENLFLILCVIIRPQPWPPFRTDKVLVIDSIPLAYVLFYGGWTLQ